MTTLRSTRCFAKQDTEQNQCLREGIKKGGVNKPLAPARPTASLGQPRADPYECAIREIVRLRWLALKAGVSSDVVYGVKEG